MTGAYPLALLVHAVSGTAGRARREADARAEARTHGTARNATHGIAARRETRCRPRLTSSPPLPGRTHVTHKPHDARMTHGPQSFSERPSYA